jgi:Rad3-related DNA helicase
MLLMSGTLMPLTATVSELGRTFRQRLSMPLEVGHVISHESLALVATGQVASTKIECNFRAWKRSDFLQAVGKAILSLCHSIPGGILVFLPSYEILERCTENWQQRTATKKKAKGAVQRITEDDGCNIWDALIAVKSDIITEPPPASGRCKGEYSNVQTAKLFEHAKRSYENAVRRDGHALLLAVYRGRMSEGVSFHDDFARGVICVGIPFPNLTEERLKQKRLCNDFFLSQGIGSVSGDVWYESRAFQAVAQALGRCIRHPDDYGALVLLDSRWVELRKAANLPKWLQPFFEDHTDIAAAATRLTTHFTKIVNKRGASPNSVATPQMVCPKHSATEGVKDEPGTDSQLKSTLEAGSSVWRRGLLSRAQTSSAEPGGCIDLD